MPQSKINGFVFNTVGKAEEDARLAPCYDDNAAKRKKSRFNAWFAFNTAGYGDGSKAAAPGLCELSDGRIVLTFQTDEDSGEKGDGYSEAKFIVLTPELSPVTSSVTVFGGKYTGVTTWGGVYSDGKTVYYASGSPVGAAMARFVP